MTPTPAPTVTPIVAPTVPTVPAANGKIGGSFIQPDLVDGWSDSQLDDELSIMRSMNMSTIVLQWSANSHDNQAGGGRTAVYPSVVPGFAAVTSTDVVGRLLAKAAVAGVSVWVGLEVNDDWWRVYASDPNWLSSEAATATAVARDLWSRYGGYSSLKGWYLPLEMDNVNFGSVAAQDNMIAFFNDVISDVKAVSDSRPVAIAPFFNAISTSLTGWQDAQAYGQTWQRILGQTDIDVVALQDGVGAGHATVGTLAPWFSAIRDAITASGSSAYLVGDIETYVIGGGNLQPMTSKDIVADLDAINPYVTGFWAFSFNHYQSPHSKFGIGAFYNAYRLWTMNGGDGTDGSAPTVPGTPAAVVNDPQTITVTWDKPTDQGSGVAGYHILRDGELVAAVLGDDAMFVDRQLNGGQTYRYQIEAFDGSGLTSGWSTEVSATTPPLPAALTNYARCAAANGQPGCTYTTSTPADGAYPDSGGALTDGRRGQALYGPEWQGRKTPGVYSFTVDLGFSRDITEINLSVLQVRQDYVFLPPNVTYAVSDDGVAFTQVASIDMPAVSAQLQTKTLRAINLTSQARYVKVTVDGGTGWTMLDEIEVRGN